MKYYLFRHGATRASSTDNIYHGDEIVTAEILDPGKPIVKKLAEHLKDRELTNFYTSQFKRNIQTMEIVKSVTGFEYIVDSRLGEFREDENESFDDFSKRIKSFIDEIKELDLVTVSVCTHGAGLSAIKNWLLKGSYEYSDLVDFPISGILWTIENGKFEEVDFNLKEKS